MSNSTISIGFKVEEGGDGFKKLKLDAEALRKVMQSNVTEAEKMKKSFLNFSTAAMGFDSVAKSIEDLAGLMGELSDAYAVQIEAETKLETVMRQRMAATAAEIQGIKDLCSAQQELGVIGDEVQLAGAQQVSTFLTTRGALETLIPAMNNLVAQQKGLNATSSDAVNIGNLLGKAMQGQTSALRRVGITFSEAEEQAMKYGTEEERAATLAQIITNNVGEMNAALAATPAGQLKQVSNAIGDMKEQVGAALQSVMPLVQQANQLVLAFGNITKVYGALKNVTAYIRTLGKQTAATTKEVTILGKTIQTNSAITKAFGVTFRATMVAVKTALIATGIGAAVWAIGEAFSFLVGELNKTEKAAGDAGGELDGIAAVENQIAEAAGRAQAQVNGHLAAIKNFNGSKQAEQKLVDELNDAYGETMGYFETLSQWYDTLTKNSETYVKQLTLEAQARVLSDKLAKAEERRYNLTHKADGSKKDKDEQPYSLPKNQNGVNLPTFKEDPRVKNINGIKIPNTATIIHDYVEDFVEKTITNIQKDLAENAKQRAQLKMPVSGASTRPGNGGNSKPSPSVKEVAPEGSIKAYEDKISELEAKVKLTTDPESIMAFTRQVEELKSRVAELRIFANIEIGRERMEEIAAEMEANPLTIKVNVDDADLQKTLQDIPAQFKEAQNPAKNLNAQLNGVAEVARSAASAFSTLGESMESPALNIMGIVAGAIANVMAGYASASAQAGGLGPWGWAAFAVSGLAQALAVVSQIKQATAFADGGIVSGPTMALVGEYAGAKNNPEVIAPLNKLRDMIDAGGGSQRVVVEGRIRGADIVLAQRNYMAVAGVSGRR